jgi:hypothetical protein
MRRTKQERKKKIKQTSRGAFGEVCFENDIRMLGFLEIKVGSKFEVLGVKLEKREYD